ncbi:MAG: 6,7-dimethyl-8-ribityllumazine synthase [Verrucomicrobiota bacterium]
MSKSSPESPSISRATGSIGIVASRYNSTYTDALVNAASETLKSLAPSTSLTLVRVPGAFEIPLPIESLAKQNPKPLALIALGVIIRGSTAHADLIAESITHSLHRTSLSYEIPVIHEVLLVDNAEQAEARTIGETLNRGREAAEAAVEMISVMAGLKASD